MSTVFCPQCGKSIAADVCFCPNCGATNAAMGLNPDATASSRKYGVAVVLCGIFGILGLHHFYLGNCLHGLFDLGLFIGMVVCFYLAGGQNGGTLAMLGIAFLLTDIIHTMVVFYLLIVGKQRDGQGRLVTYAGSAV
jgi:hypothetical protein